MLTHSHNPKTLRIRSFFTKNGYFLVFFVSRGLAFSCKHETHNLLALVLLHIYNNTGNKLFKVS